MYGAQTRLLHPFRGVVLEPGWMRRVPFVVRRGSLIQPLLQCRVGNKPHDVIHLQRWYHFSYSPRETRHFTIDFTIPLLCRDVANMGHNADNKSTEVGRTSTGTRYGRKELALWSQTQKSRSTDESATREAKLGRITDTKKIIKTTFRFRRYLLKYYRRRCRRREASSGEKCYRFFFRHKSRRNKEYKKSN